MSLTSLVYLHACDEKLTRPQESGSGPQKMRESSSIHRFLFLGAEALDQAGGVYPLNQEILGADSDFEMRRRCTYRM